MIKRLNREANTRRSQCPPRPKLWIDLPDATVMWRWPCGKGTDVVMANTTQSWRIKIPANYPFGPPHVCNFPFAASAPKIDFWTWAVLVAPDPGLSNMWPDFVENQCLCCIAPQCHWAPNRRVDDVAAHAGMLLRVCGKVPYGRILERWAEKYLLNMDVVRHIFSYVVARDKLTQWVSRAS